MSIEIEEVKGTDEYSPEILKNKLNEIIGAVNAHTRVIEKQMILIETITKLIDRITK